MAAQLYKSAKEIVTAGEKNPAIFELAVLFEPKFGPDSLSDMTIKILLPELLKFNERIAKKLNLPMKKSRVHGRLVKLVHSKRQDMSVLLIPHSILAKLPLATDWSEIDDVVAYNRSVREQINQEVSKALGERITDPTKPEIRDVLLKNSPILRELLKRYGKAKATPYDFEKDPLGLMSWYRTMRQLAEKNPLKLDRPKTTEEVYQLVRTVCDQFKHQVEENEIAGLLFNDNGIPEAVLRPRRLPLRRQRYRHLPRTGDRAGTRRLQVEPWPQGARICRTQVIDQRQVSQWIDGATTDLPQGAESQTRNTAPPESGCQ